MAATDHNSITEINAAAQIAEHHRRVWRIVSHCPLDSLWDTEGVSAKTIARRTMKAVLDDRIFSRAAELGFYFLFALFPALICASAIFGLVARSATQIYDKLLAYLALVVPNSALSAVMHTFHQTTAASTSGKITFSLLGAIWSASVGISAIQETLNEVYKIEDTRSYLHARISAIGVTLVVAFTGTLSLTAMFGGDWIAKFVHRNSSVPVLSSLAADGVRLGSWALATALLMLSLAMTYYWAPDWRRSRWRLFTPGATLGVAGWLLASLGFRLYLHYFNSYTVTYGSLGAVVILLMWFYITGLMLLVGGELNSEIEAAVVEKRLIETHRADRAEQKQSAAA